LNAGENIVSSAVIDPAGGYAYFATTDSEGTSSPAIIVRIRLSDFTRAGSLTLNDYESSSNSAVIDTVAGFAYFGTNYGYLVKIRLSDFSRVGALYLSEAYPDAAVIDTVAGFAYFNMYSGINNGLSAVKVSLSSFTIVDTISLGTGGCCEFSAVIDPSAGFAYFDETGSVVKVRLSDFTYLGVLFLQPGGGAAVIDPSAGFAYFSQFCYFDNRCQNYSADFVVKVRLANFTEVTRIPYPEPGPSISAVIDTVNGFAYFGTTSSPGSIVKVAVGSYFPVVDNPFTSNGGVANGRVTINVRSNSTISQFHYSSSARQIDFSVSGEDTGVANVTIPKSEVPSGGRMNVTVDHIALTPQISQDTNNYYVYFTYHLSTHVIQLTFAVPTAGTPLGFLTSLWATGRKWLPVGGAIVAVLFLVVGGILAVRRRRQSTSAQNPRAR
jgi:hypothetical protein